MEQDAVDVFGDTNVPCPLKRAWNHNWRDFYVVPHHWPLATASLARTSELVSWIEELLADTSLWLDGTCWIAGGAVRDAVIGQSRKDLDLFFPLSGNLESARSALLERGWIADAESLAAYRMVGPAGDAIDLVRRLRKSPLETIQQFDFVSCCAAVSSTHVAYHREFVSQAEARVLGFNACPAPRHSVKRALSLIQRGWTMAKTDVDLLIAEGVERAGTGDGITSYDEEDGEGTSAHMEAYTSTVKHLREATTS